MLPYILSLAIEFVSSTVKHVEFFSYQIDSGEDHTKETGFRSFIHVTLSYFCLNLQLPKASAWISDMEKQSTCNRHWISVLLHESRTFFFLLGQFEPRRWADRYSEMSVLNPSTRRNNQSWKNSVQPRRRHSISSYFYFTVQFNIYEWLNEFWYFSLCLYCCGKSFKRGTNTPRMVLGLWAATEN
jgi:hypothetical protein